MAPNILLTYLMNLKNSPSVSCYFSRWIRRWIYWVISVDNLIFGKLGKEYNENLKLI